MKTKKIISSLLVLGLLGGAVAPVWAAEKEHNEKAEAKEGVKGARKESKMEVVARAKLTQKQAARIALSKVPKGKIKEADLEMERGILMWSFDVAIPGSSLTAEVNINAVTGELVGLDLESPAAEAKEAEAHEAKEGKAKEARTEAKATKASKGKKAAQAEEAEKEEKE